MSFRSKCLDTEITIVELKTRNEKKRTLSRPRILCDVRGHLRQQTLVHYLVSSFTFFSAGVLNPPAFCVFLQLSVLHEERGSCDAVFLIGSNFFTHSSVDVCEEVSL